MEEWEIFKNPIVFFGIVFGAIMQFLHNAAHNYVYYLAGVYQVYGGPANQLVDLGFKALQPSIANLSFLPSNGCLYALAAIALVATAVYPFFTEDNIRVYSVQIIWRALLVCSITIVFRCVSFLLTILPAPAPQCGEADFDPPNTASEIFFKFNTENGCSDLIFSSHMMYGLLASCLVIHYVRKGRLLKIFLSVLCVSLNIAEAFCIVAQERHYTIDVWNALYAVPLTWIAFTYFVPLDPGSIRKPVITKIETLTTTNETNDSVIIGV